jgi:hypothetical protein
MSKKNKSNIGIVIIVILLLLLFFKGCEDKILSLDIDKANPRYDSGSSRLFSDWSLTSLMITSGLILDPVCMEGCADIWVPCFENCDTLYCDNYFNCLGDCDDWLSPCWNLDNCEDLAMNFRLSCNLECGLWYDDPGGYDLETELEILESYPWINETVTLTECTNTCIGIHVEIINNCSDEFESDCDLCQENCYDDNQGEDCLSCEEFCEDGALECVEPCVTEGEIYLWDSEPVTDVGAFYEEGFPHFYERFSELCEGDYFEGVWISTSNTMGCVDADLFYYEDCDEFPMISSANVCETIGGTWTCDAECDSDECAEPAAILTCEV